LKLGSRDVIGETGVKVKGDIERRDGVGVVDGLVEFAVRGAGAQQVVFLHPQLDAAHQKELLV
jgi:hypothetical protein